jgi:hypothetical protein
MNELEHRILTHLKNHHRGSNNAITYKALSVELRINSRELRYAVANIVTSGEGCIGSNSVSGYFFITDDEELNYCHSELVSRIKKLAKRARGLRRARMNDKLVTIEQQKLFAEVA